MRNPLAQNIRFTPLDPKYRTVIWITHALLDVPVLVILIVLCVLFGDTSFPGLFWWIGLAVYVIVVLWLLWVELRGAKVFGYAELEEELVIRKGILFHRVEVVPYGRMQQIQLEAGPIMSRFGLASVELITAAATTRAKIPGVQRAEAERLRQKLTALGQAQMEGL